MSAGQDPPEKDKPRKFLLPSALRHLQETKRVQTQHFIKQFQQQPAEQQPKRQKKQTHSLFKLNPSSTAIVSEVPVESLRQRSKSNRLESLHSDPRQNFSLLDHLKSGHEKRIDDKRPTLKKYNIDLRQLNVTEVKKQPQSMEVEEEDQKYEIVKPSNTYSVSIQKKDQIFQPTIFQTPILPCFASEFHARGSEPINKKVNEGEGVWLVGKLKVKGGSCRLKIGEFQFEGSAVRGEGKAGVISGLQLLSLPNWREMWILQPEQSIFL